MAAIPNALMLERMEPDWSGRGQAITAALAASGGQLTVPEGPGLGVKIDEAFVAEHPSVRNAGLPSGGWNAGTAQETVYQQARRPRQGLTRTHPKDRP